MSLEMFPTFPKIRTEQLDAVAWDQLPALTTLISSMAGRMDFKDRFVLQGNVGGPGPHYLGEATTIGLSTAYVVVPPGKSLYLKRLRFRFADPGLRARVMVVGGTISYTSSSNYGDLELDVLVADSSSVISLVAYASSSSHAWNADAVWAEFEIR